MALAMPAGSAVVNWLSSDGSKSPSAAVGHQRAALGDRRLVIFPWRPGIR
jgi:hypothetical protein